MIKLSKAFSRQKYPLFFCYVWSESDLQRMQKWLGNTIQHLVMLHEEDKVSVWYDPTEVEIMHRAFTTNIENDRQWFKNVSDSFYEYWNKLLPYINEERKIRSADDLKEYYELWLDWWPLMAILFEIPNVDSLPLDIREKALKAREETQDFSDGGEEVIEHYFKNNHPHFVSLWRIMTPDEMFRLDMLSADQITDIKQRKQGWALVNGKLIALDELDRRIGELGIKLEEERVENNIREIAGQSACRGKATGKVRLVLKGNDIAKLREGEILVTEMTTPAFVPAMKKAAAIITDEGGITCHAAIVSRELNKPCIIGTKIATKALEDADEVEVDADNGIVMIL